MFTGLLFFFEEYLYRVIASNEGGSVSSAWTRVRTRESGKYNCKSYLFPFLVSCVMSGWGKSHHNSIE